jgi:eukaryotic-like serine/threonine-protein kinase
MTPEEWREIKAILGAALEIAPGERASYLEEACGGNGPLRSELESLLASYGEAGSFIEHPAAQLGAAAVAPARETLPAGTELGPYRIVQLIAEGGMGAVYQAVRVDDLYRKVVAIKVIKRGVAGDYALKRFDIERQILAHLDHPNIARLLDGGTTADGRPYFVMDFIAGTPIDEYCDAHRLIVRERLSYFLAVCSAVHYAHQNLVIHRDLKPQNILITEDGSLKLLDFGIAKLLDADGPLENTITLFQALTPEYASPEQLGGEIVSTASDVYSLGVLLYRLLTGHRPYALATRSLEEIWDSVRWREPRRPSLVVRCEEQGPAPGGDTVMLTPELVGAARSTRPDRLERELSGDLDNIILMALRKEPLRRYASVEQLAGDVKRYLGGHPVLARQDTLAYRAVKFVKRHRAGVLGAALLAVTMVAGTAATAWQAHVATRQRRLAERRFDDLRGLAKSVLFELHDAIAPLPGSTAARELLIQRARRYLDALSAEGSGDDALEYERAMAYERIGDVLGLPSSPNLGQTAEALQSYQKALTIEWALAAGAGAPRLQPDMARLYNRICALEESAGEYRRSLDACLQAERIQQAQASQRPGDAGIRAELATTYQNLANSYFALGDWRRSEEQRTKALHEFEALRRERPDNEAYLSQLAIAHRRMAALQEQTKRYTAARKSALKAIALFEGFATGRPNDIRARLDWSFSQQRLGSILLAQNDLEGALKAFQQVLPIREGIWALDPQDAGARINLANSHAAMGSALLAMGKLREAQAHFERQRQLAEELARLDPVRVDQRTILSDAYENLGRVAQRVGRTESARAYWKQALQLYDDLRARGAIPAEYAEAPARIQKALEELR